MTTSPTGLKVPFLPTWMNTMHGQPPWHTKGVAHDWQQSAAIAAANAHYPFLFWNGRVYLLEPIGEGSAAVVANHDTGWLQDDIDAFTANHPGIERFQKFSKDSW